MNTDHQNPTVPLADYEALKAENRALRAQIATLLMPTAMADVSHDHESAASFIAFLDSLPIPIQLYSADGYLWTMNRASEQFWKLSREAATAFNILHDPQMVEQGVPDLIMRAREGEIVATDIISLDTAQTDLEVDEECKNWISSTFFPFDVTVAGETTRYVGVINYDITGIMAKIAEKEEEVHAHERLLLAILDTTSLIIVMLNRDGTIARFNQTAQTLMGYTEDEVIHRAIWDIFILPEDREAVQGVFNELNAGMFPNAHENHWLAKDGSRRLIAWNNTVLMNQHGEIEYVIGTGVDITERRAREQEHMQLQQHIIETQQAALRELSAPLLPIADGVIAMPLVGSIDSRRAQDIMETLLEGIATYQADIAIVDITGVRIVDTQVAQAIIRTAQAVRLLGAQIVLTGIQPPIAQTLVHLGADLREIITRSTLQAGIAYAIDT